MRPLALFGVFALVSLLTRAVLIPAPLVDVDEAAHVVGSWELLRGGELYRDFVDNKPPLVYAYYAAAQLLFGRGLAAVRLATALVTVPLIALAAASLFRFDRRGVVAGCVFLVASAAFYGHDMLAVHCELIYLAPLAWAMAIVWHEEAPQPALRFLVAGLLVGIATLVKPTAATWLLPLTVASLSRVCTGGRRAVIASLTTAGAGAAIPLGLALAYFTWRGTAEAFLYWTVLSNLDYAAYPATLAEVAGRVAGKLLPFVVVTAPLVAYGWASIRQGFSTHERRLVIAMALGCVPGIVIGWRFYPHYYVPLYFPLAVGAAPALTRALGAPVQRSARLAMGWLGLAFVAFQLSNVLLYWTQVEVYEETRPTYARVANRLSKDRCTKGSTLFVWGFAPAFYVSTELAPASRFVMPQASLVGYLAGRRRGDPGRIRTSDWDLLMADLEVSRPAYILDTSPAGLHHWQDYPIHLYPRLEELVRTRYELVAVIDGVGLHRRLDCSSRDR